MQQVRALVRLIDRLEEFSDDYKLDLEPDDMVAIDEAISVIDRVKSELEDPEEAVEELY